MFYNSPHAPINAYDDILVLIRYIDKSYCYAYVPYGPKLAPCLENHGLFLEQVSETIRPHLPADYIFIRYDLLWQNQWAVKDEYFDATGNWLGPTRNRVQDFRLNYKTAKWNLRKCPIDFLPKNTFFLDLTLKKRTLLYNMRYNTRYNIRRSMKKGIHVREYGVEHIGDWYKIYQKTAARHHLALKSEAYFTSIMKNQGNRKKGVVVKMLMADFDGKHSAAMFLFLCNKSSIYLYGSSLAANKELTASYALQWESIKIAKMQGCSEYDMFGSAPNLKQSHPLHGVHIYKKGFGGELFHRMGCWDYPYHQKGYDIFRSQELKYP